MTVMEESDRDVEDLHRRDAYVTPQRTLRGEVPVAPSRQVKKWIGRVGYWDVAGNRKLQDGVYTVPAIVAYFGSGSLRHYVPQVKTQVLALNDSMFLFGAQGADIWTSRFAWKKYRDDLKLGVLSTTSKVPGGGIGNFSSIVEMQYAPDAKLALALFHGGEKRMQTGLLLWQVDVPMDGWFSWPMNKKITIPYSHRLDWQEGTVRAFRISADGTRAAVIGENNRLHLYRLPDFERLATVALPMHVTVRIDLILADVEEDSVTLLAVTEKERDPLRRRLDVARFIWHDREGIEEVDTFCAQRVGFPTEGYFGYVTCDNSTLHVLPTRPHSGRPAYSIDLPIRFD